MNATNIAAIVLIVAGVLGLAYGGFTYTRDTQQAKIGPIEMTITDRQTVNIPVWLGAGSIIAGVVLLVMVRSKN
jgi:uncharacterized membrane protein YidH (DUF202 family)